MRLIDRDVLWKKVTTQIEYCGEILEIIKSVPIIEAKPVRHGKWIMVDHLWQCDKCHTRQNEKTPTNYCPNCGAKMEARLTPEGIARALLRWKSEEERDEE